MKLTFITSCGDRHDINPALHDLDILWRAGWRLTGFVGNSPQDRSLFSEYISLETDFLARQQQQRMETQAILDDWRLMPITPLGPTLSDHYGIVPGKVGDSPKTAATSSKGKNTFKAFIQRTTNTV